MKFAEAKAELLEELCRLVAQSGEVDSGIDLAAWLDAWLKEPSPELRGATPAQALRNASGRHQVLKILERMRGGLPA
ncbi:MbcA/ParS/Xre antitoxin family protein [Roseateles sp. LYH14W]|uniref:MbcA/ParS/Xre antitoxin family protein n=2 Tax=Pelomonas parva TaxID=3299032 RepID=A0ABW7FAC9_9BURK